MRLATLLMVLGLLVGTALADKPPVQNEKDWHFDATGMRNIAEVEPNDTCPGQEFACGDVVDAYLGPHSPAEDIDWFRFYAEAGMWITLGTDAGPAPDHGDTRLYIFQDDCATQLAFDDDSSPNGYYSLISNFVAPYTGYYEVRVESYPYSTLDEGSYILYLTCTVPQEPPVNDQCAGAIEIPRCSDGVIEGDVTLALNDYDLPAGNTCTGFTAAGRDIAYVMNLMAGDIVDLLYVGGYDESMYIVTDCGDEVGTCQIGADDTVGTGEAITGWVAPASGTYYLICDAWGTNVGNDFTLTYAITCPAVPNESVTWGKVKSMFE